MNILLWNEGIIWAFTIWIERIFHSISLSRQRGFGSFVTLCVCVCVWRWRNVFDKTNKTQWENFKRKSCWSVAKISPSVLDHTHIRTHAHKGKKCWIVACSLNKQLMSIDQSDARTAMMMVYMYGCVLYQRHGFLPQSFSSFVLFCASFNFTPLAYHFIMFTVECGQRGTYHKLLCYLYAPGIIYLLS